MKRSDRNSAIAATDSPTLAATMTGVYLATFYVTNNQTMLSVQSIVVIALVLIVPFVAGIALMSAILRSMRRESLGRALAVGASVLYMLVVLRGTVFHIDAIRHFFVPAADFSSIVAKFIYYVVPTLALALLFREHLKKFSIVLGAMTAASLATALMSAADQSTELGEVYGNETEQALHQVRFADTPNVYFIVADSYASFAYLNTMRIDVSGFRKELNDAGFRLYDDVYSNYHATTAAMLAMLNMGHHYYLFNSEASEVTKTGREVIAGQNKLVNTFRRNGYDVQYIHQGSYLLLHGCSADICFGTDPYYGARVVMNEILPGALKTRLWQPTSIEGVRDEVTRLLQRDSRPDTKRFQYIHLFQPGHASNQVQGICEPAEEIAAYSRRIDTANEHLADIIDDILSADPRAIIVLASDHGPFFENSCQRKIDIDTVDEYRDRAGAMLAIRWPADYDGRYDNRIRSMVNVFRYVLASFAENDAEVLETVVPDDVYVLGDDDILRIMERGELLESPHHFTKNELQNAHRLR